MPKETTGDWLLIFYSVPSHPVSNRMKIWRKLAKTGAVQLKGSVYILPASEEHEELFQWLIGEVKAMGGDGWFVRTADIRTIPDAEIRRFFTAQTDREYRLLEKSLDVLDRKVQSIRKGAKRGEPDKLAHQLSKHARELEDIAQRDFFKSETGVALRKRLFRLEGGLKEIGRTSPEKAAEIALRRIDAYQGRTWATRKHPFVDRMASAWLIRRFIDPKAVFQFIDERDVNNLGPVTAAFDISGGEFTHVGDFCTFEVLVKSFGIKDRAVKKMAELVHDLDVKDEKYGKPEASGVEDILTGIRKTAKSDTDALERGMAAFEMLYQSKT